MVTPKVVDAPDAVAGSGASGSVKFSITPGVAGAFPITASGLNAGTAQSGDLAVGRTLSSR